MFGWRGNFSVFPVVSVYGYCRAIRDVIARLVTKDGKHFVQPQPVYEWPKGVGIERRLARSFSQSSRPIRLSPLLPEAAQKNSPTMSAKLYKAVTSVIPMGLTLAFLKGFATGLWLTSPLLLSLVMAICLLGRSVGKKEGWSLLDTFYWSFITATTVGYGDLRPAHRRSKIVAIFIAFLGLILSGIVIAVAVNATTLALKAFRQ